MLEIKDYVQRGLKWEQPSAFKSEYLLRSGEEVVASLKFRSAWGTHATAESADGCWTFKRMGFFQTRATVRACDSEEDLAVFRHNTWSGGGTLILTDGREFPATTNFWQTNLEFQDSSGEPLLVYKSGGFFRFSADVEIFPSAVGMTELPWMVMFGWYLLLMMYNDSAAATAAAAT
ncbi:MAG: hypothetical protein JW726_07955 [Anaerolineales bacterium]|nr:hypothetical protein [Anaerolineales bacterium]